MYIVAIHRGKITQRRIAARSVASATTRPTASLGAQKVKLRP
jgi:hypothetical protein